MSRLPVLIAGGGIGGLATAIGLAGKGIGSLVLERAPQLGEIGADGLWSNVRQRVVGDGAPRVSGHTTYRSVIYTTSDAQLAQAKAARDTFQQALTAAGHRPTITTEIEPLDLFYYAEDYHQQYLAKNPGGYCGLRGTGVSCHID